MEERDLDILRRAGYEIGVSSFEIEREVQEIISRERLPIVIDYYGIAGFSFDRETGNVLVNPRLVVEDLEKLLKTNPNFDWKRYARDKIKHEMVHKNQEELLTARGVSPEERESIPYVMLKQLHALRVVPPMPEENEVRRGELLRIPKEERYGVIYKVMEIIGPAIITDYAVALTRKEIEEEFPEEYRDVALKLKDLYPSMETADDIIRHSSQVKRIVKGGRG